MVLKSTELETLAPTIGLVVKFNVRRPSPVVNVGVSGAPNDEAPAPVAASAALLSDAGPVPTEFMART